MKKMTITGRIFSLADKHKDKLPKPSTKAISSGVSLYIAFAVAGYLGLIIYAVFSLNK